ncbi:putative leader peptide [Micromonospora sp. ATCC 39149]
MTVRRGRRHHGVMAQRDEFLLIARMHVDLVRHAGALC